MSYVTRQQKDWIQMLYGDDSNHDDYQIMLETFATLVEKTVLPAEQKTEIQRSKNPTRDFRERIALKDSEIKKLLKSIVDESQESGEVKGDAVHRILDAMDDVSGEISQDEKIDVEVYRKITEFGITAVAFHDELGGLGFPYPLFILFLEILGKASPSVGVRFAISNTCAEGLRFNHESGRLSKYCETILEKLIAGELLAAFALTEGSVAGSNILQEMQTRAVLSKDGTHYSITGKKMWITNAETADVFALFARTSEDINRGVSLFLVEKGTEGFSLGQVFEKRIVENSSLGELVFENVKVPIENRVGEEGSGAQYAIRMLNSGRITIAALAVGLAQRAFEEYMQTAVQGKKCAGKYLIEYDRTKAKVAEMSMELNAARDMTVRAAWLKERYDSDPENPEVLREYVIAANGAKLKSSMVAMKACDYFVKIGGASSVVKETFSLKYYLDSFLYYFGEAVPEVLENTISHMETMKYKNQKGL